MTQLKMHVPCNRCNRTLRELMLEAMAMEAGAKVYPSPLDCDHDFEDRGSSRDVPVEELEKP